MEGGAGGQRGFVGVWRLGGHCLVVGMGSGSGVGAGGGGMVGVGCGVWGVAEGGGEEG